MNCVDFLLQDNYKCTKDFILGRNVTLSYNEMSDSVLKLKNWINEEIGVGQNILLIMPNCNQFVISYLAIMKSGNVVVPLNPTIESSSLNDIITRCDANVLISSRQVVKRLQPKVEILVTEPEIDSILEGSLQNEWDKTNTQPNDLAQIIFTSGSTATPKGVMISHKNIIANTSSIVKYLGLTDKDIMEVVLPFFYCYGLSLLHTHLKVQGSIVLNNTFIFLGSVLDDFKKYKCTGFAGVPSHFQILLRKSDSFKQSEFPHLRYVTQAGGKLHKAFIEEFNTSHPEIDFIVMYGQTEATARLSYLPFNILNKKLGSIGKGIPDVDLQVVNSEGEKVKVGEVGEIIAKGDNVMLGYYNEPEETAKAIKDNWLYTGDLASVDEDGFIYHAARRKEIIKVGGRRISPKEIEEVIVGINGVIDCSIEAIEDVVWGEAIKAILVVNKDEYTISEEFVKRYCSERLSNYKVPQVVDFVEKLKVNSTGKKVKA